MIRLSGIPRRWLAALAALPTLIPAGATAQAAATQASERFGDMWFSFPYPSRETGLLRDATPVGGLHTWASGVDFPADALAAGLKGVVHMRLAVDAEGAVTGCAVTESQADPLLQQHACRLVRQRARFEHALSQAGKPVATTVDISLYYAIRNSRFMVPAPPAPPPPGARAYGGPPGWELRKAPDWAAFAPAGKPNGELVVDLSIYPNRSTPAGPRIFCFVSRSSGNPTLDAATCEALKSAAFRQLPQSGRFPALGAQLLVSWKKGRARVEVPSRQRTPLVILDQDKMSAVQTNGARQSALIEASFQPDGTIDCRVLQTSGADEVDVAFCALARGLHFTPAVDAFGRKIAAKRRFRADP